MAAIKRITQFGSESWVRFSKFRRVSAVSAEKKVQTGGSLGYYSQKSNGLQDHRPEKLPYDIEMGIDLATSRQISEDSKKEFYRQTERLRADLEARNNNLTILVMGTMVFVSACFAVINEVDEVRFRKRLKVAQSQGPASDEKK